MIPLVALFLCLPPICAKVEATDSEATEAAESYRKLFEQIETFEEDLGDRYLAILNPEDYPDVVVSEADRSKIEIELDSQFKQLSQLAQVPVVDWGLKAEIEAKGPNATFPQFAPIRHLVKASVWQSKNHFEHDSDRAINYLMDAMSLAHQQNQETKLISHLMRRACNDMVLDAVAELSPQMTSVQRETLLQHMHQLPATGTLADALTTERDFFVGWFQRRIAEELEIWETENGGSHGYHFSEDLRLASILLLPDMPARISLHNTVKEQTFWLEIGLKINGIFLEKVDKATSQAWIRLDDELAVIDLKKSTIESRYVSP